MRGRGNPPPGTPAGSIERGGADLHAGAHGNALPDPVPRVARSTQGLARLRTGRRSGSPDGRTECLVHRSARGEAARSTRCGTQCRVGPPGSVGKPPGRDTGGLHRTRRPAIFMLALMETLSRLPSSDPPRRCPKWAAPVPLAARTEDAVKVYGKGGTEVRALDGVTVGLPAGRFTADHGPVRLRQEHADALPRRARHAHLRPGLPRRHRARRALRPRAHPGPARAHRVRVPGVQPAADARRLREHHAADGARRPPAEQGVGAHGRRHRRPRPTA